MVVEMTYEELLIKFKDCEIDNRKTRMSFIQRLCEYLEYDVPYSRFKPLVMGTIRPESNGEIYVKSAYDAYNYLLANPKAFIGETLLKKFYYILTGQELDREIAFNLQSFYHDFGDKPVLEKIIGIHFYIFQVFNLNSEREKKLIAFLITNYLLVVYRLAPVRLYKRDFVTYEDIKNLYEQGDNQSAMLFFLELINKQKPLSKDYYANLKPMTTKELIALIKQDEDLLKKMYRVANLAIFGSFANHRVRYDSDIDILVKFDRDMSYIDKEHSVEELRRFTFNRYGRICDVHDVLPYLEENDIKGFVPYIKVF